jgi:DNA-binding transcriptional regulator YiaG
MVKTNQIYSSLAAVAANSVYSSTLAGQKIERWRKAQVPAPMSRQSLADSLGIEPTALQKYERRGTVPQRQNVVQLLAERGICQAADWFVSAPALNELPICTLCQLRVDALQVADCAHADCPNPVRQVA